MPTEDEGLGEPYEHIKYGKIVCTALWIVERVNEMASPLGGSHGTDVQAAELESCFDYLKYQCTQVDPEKCSH